MSSNENDQPKNGAIQTSKFKTLDEIIDAHRVRPEPEPALPRYPGRWVEHSSGTWTYIRAESGLSEAGQPETAPSEEDLQVTEDGQEEWVVLRCPVISTAANLPSDKKRHGGT